MKNWVKSNLYPIQVYFGENWNRRIVIICHCFDEKTQNGSEFGRNLPVTKMKIESEVTWTRVKYILAKIGAVRFLLFVTVSMRRLKFEISDNP